MTAEAMPTGAWELPEDLRMLQDLVRRFMETEVRPLEETLHHDAAGLPPERLAPLQKKARDLGLWALQTPAEFGGAGLGVLGQVIAAEEAAKCRMGAYFPALGAFGGNPPSVLFKATPEQWERWGRPIVEGGAERPFNALSEPAGGSDLARAIQCRAERVSGGYLLNGVKLWITHAGRASWGVVYARTGPPGERGGVSCFIVEANTPGLTMRPVGVMTSYSPFELHFEDAIIPADQLVGEEGQGFRLADDFLVRGRITYAAGTIGVAQYALEMAIEWARQREAFGSRLADKQAIQWMVADSAIELQAARLLTYQAAWKADLGQELRVEASMAKVYGTETAFRVVDRCIQIFGALGVSKELPLERWFRELRVKRLGEGTSEIQRMMIAKSLLGTRHSA